MTIWGVFASDGYNTTLEEAFTTKDLAEAYVASWRRWQPHLRIAPIEVRDSLEPVGGRGDARSAMDATPERRDAGRTRRPQHDASLTHPM